MSQFDSASFNKLSSCDKVLLLAKLIRDLPLSHIKLLSTICQCLTRDDECLKLNPRFNVVVQQANNKHVIHALNPSRASPHHNDIDEKDESDPDTETDETNSSSNNSESTENSLEQLLYYLPAYNKRDAELKNAYMSLIFRSIDDASTVNNMDNFSELQKILSVHPLFTKEERETIDGRLSSLLTKNTNNNAGSLNIEQQKKNISSTPAFSRLLLSKQNSLPFNISTVPFQQYHNMLNHNDLSAFHSNGINVAFNSNNECDNTMQFRTPQSTVIQRPVKDYSSPLSVDLYAANKIGVNSGANSATSLSQTSSLNSNASFSTPSTVSKVVPNQLIPPKRQLCPTTSEPKKATTQYENILCDQIKSHSNSDDALNIYSGDATFDQILKYKSFTTDYNNNNNSSQINGAASSLMHDSNKSMLKFANDDYNRELNTFTTAGSGMKDVPTWLKNLRLHKYTHIFCRINYDQMIELSEQYLSQECVTKGARDKILLQLRKLKDRSKRIIQIKNLIESSDFKQIQEYYYELNEISLTPIRPYEFKNEQQYPLEDDRNLTVAIISILSELKEKIVSLQQQQFAYTTDTKPFDNFCTHFVQLIDRFYNNDSFSQDQKSRMKEIRGEIYELNTNLQTNFHPELKRLKSPKFNSNYVQRQKLKENGTNSFPNSFLLSRTPQPHHGHQQVTRVYSTPQPSSKPYNSNIYALSRKPSQNYNGLQFTQPKVPLAVGGQDDSQSIIRKISS